MTNVTAAKVPAFEIEEATIAELQTAMDRQVLNAQTLVGAYRDRIEQMNDSLNAFICLNPKAEEAAARLDKARANGDYKGLLHGIPLVVKDNIDTGDMPTTGGCKGLEGQQPSDDAFAVARLRAAGAIILGKANLHELALSGESVSGLGGQACNPYNLEYTPGGSSGGTAVAIAANLSTAGLGSDTLNSVRSPASACNIVGLRPTSGLVSRDGLMPVSLSQDVIGPMARSVADVATLLDAIACDDPTDPMTARSAGQIPRSYLTKLHVKGLKGKRLGVVASLLTASDRTDSAVVDVTRAALADMEALGARCLKVPVAIDIEQMIAELSLVKWEMKLHFNHYLAEMGEAASVKNLDALLKTNQIHSSVKPLLAKLKLINTPLGDAEYWQRLYQRRVELRETLTAILKANQLDALVYPHQRQKVARIGEKQAGRNGFLAAASGFPAIVVPAGFTPDDIPVGIELMAQPFQEAQLLQMAYAYEQATNWRQKPKL